MSGEQEKINSKKIVEQVIQNVMTQNDDEASMTLEEMEKQQKEADAVLGASDADNCSYSKGYVARQALYSCLTCTIDGEMAGICLACSLTCHKDCEMVELYTKRNFRCDCGNSKMKRGCDLEKNKEPINSNNTYNHNYKGLYCTCDRPYPDPDCPPELEDDEMIQCIICEDWYHGTCLKIEKSMLEKEDNGELICIECISKHEHLQYYNILNPETETVSEKCLRPKTKIEVGNCGMFVKESFRVDLCSCDLCKSVLNEDSLLFLIAQGDSMEEYEDIGQEKIEAENSQTDNQINSLLNNLDSRGQQEIAYGIHSLKSAISSMLGAVEDGGEVTADHVAIFKRKLEADIEERKKRRRLDA